MTKIILTFYSLSRTITSTNFTQLVHNQLPIYAGESLVKCLEMFVSYVYIFLPTYFSHTAKVQIKSRKITKSNRKRKGKKIKEKKRATSKVHSMPLICMD